MSIAAAVLAAGAGRRFGPDPKLLAPLVGRPVLAWSLEAALASGLRPVLCVVGAHARHVTRVVPAGVAVVHARRWRHGLAHSLRAGVGALEPWVQVEAVCVGLGDEPCIGPDAYRRLAAAYDGRATLWVATYGGRRAHPVLIPRALWPAVHTLRGDVGARALYARVPVVEVPCDGTGSPVDVDTEADLAAVAEPGDPSREERG